MTLDYNAILLIVFGIAALIMFVAFLLSRKYVAKKESGKSTSDMNSVQSPSGKEASASYSKDDVFNFMEFDKIQDNMIIQQNSEKYTAVIKCKGINYNLMSEVEQLAVEGL